MQVTHDRSPLDPRAAAVLADDAEVRAFEDLYAAAPAPLRAQLGIRVERLAGACALLAPGLGAPLFNRVVGLGLRAPANAAEVRAIGEIFRSAGATSWWLHWNPFAEPVAFSGQLLEMGFTQPPRRSWTKVMRGCEPAPEIATSLEIDATSSRAQAEETARVIVEIFDMPPVVAQWFQCLHGRAGWRLYTARDGDQVVGGAALFTSGELAWLGMGAIRSSHRRRGGQGALMVRRIADACRAGACFITTETGEPIRDEPNPSLANMKRCGFTVVASRMNFAAPAAA
jgi:hypothetical protein